jgi:hypothetical protein
MAPAETFGEGVERVRKEDIMSNSREHDTAHAGMSVMFWSWIVIIAAGLALMIALPLAGR